MPEKTTKKDKMFKLLNIQKRLAVPKTRTVRNNKGQAMYSYRNCEDILNALKPHLESEECVILLSDEILAVDGKTYVIATASLYDAESGELIASVKEPAREEAGNKSPSQATGATSSYARKRALSGLFALDDEADADEMAEHDNGLTVVDKAAVILKENGITTTDFARVMVGKDWENISIEQAKSIVNNSSKIINAYRERSTQ